MMKIKRHYKIFVYEKYGIQNEFRIFYLMHFSYQEGIFSPDKL